MISSRGRASLSHSRPIRPRAAMLCFIDVVSAPASPDARRSISRDASLRILIAALSSAWARKPQWRPTKIARLRLASCDCRFATLVVKGPAGRTGDGAASAEHRTEVMRSKGGIDEVERPATLVKLVVQDYLEAVPALVRVGAVERGFGFDALAWRSVKADGDGVCCRAPRASIF